CAPWCPSSPCARAAGASPSTCPTSPASSRAWRRPGRRRTSSPRSPPASSPATSAASCCAPPARAPTPTPTGSGPPAWRSSTSAEAAVAGREVRAVVPSLRVDVLGARAFGVSRSYFARGVGAGNVLVGGEPAGKAASVEPGQEVEAIGLGSFVLVSVDGATRRDNLRVTLAVTRDGRGGAGRGGGCRRPGEGARRSPFRWPREGSRRSGPDALAAPGALLEHHAEGHLGEPQVLADAVAQVVLV